MENKHTDPQEVSKNDGYIEKYDKDLLLDYDFDGIKELDNPPPPWLMWLFYITIAWSLGYVAYFHLYKEGDLQAEEYEKEMAEASEKYKAHTLDLDQIALLTNEADLNEGKEIYVKNCVPCHGINGEGGIGTNLADEEWLYGSQPKNVFEIIKNGNSKGMTSFSSLPDENILKVTSYVLVKLYTGETGTNSDDSDTSVNETE
jgi:cytochrome c oxidase cbb3-type subunit 3